MFTYSTLSFHLHHHQSVQGSKKVKTLGKIRQTFVWGSQRMCTHVNYDENETQNFYEYSEQTLI